MAGTFSRSWTLLKESFAVLKDNAGLIVFPVISGICTLIVSAAFFVPGFLIFGNSGESESVNPLIYVLLFLFYLVSYNGDHLLQRRPDLLRAQHPARPAHHLLGGDGHGLAQHRQDSGLGGRLRHGGDGPLRHPGERRMGGRASRRAGRHGLEPAHLLRHPGPGLRGAGGPSEPSSARAASSSRPGARAWSGSSPHRPPSSACCPSWG